MVIYYWLIFLASFSPSRASQELLLMSTTHHIRYMNTSDPDGLVTSIPLVNVSNAVAVAYDPTENYIYWSDVSLHRISKAAVNGIGQEVLFTDVYTVDGLTLDMYNRKLYWTDTANDTIESSNLDGSSRKILINKDLDEPRAIVLDVNDRRMYWTDWGSSAKIERSRLDGSEREQLVTTDLVYPNGLALDLDLRIMYWADAILDKIEVVNMDGTSRRTLFTEEGIHPFAIVIIGNYIFWSDWAKLAVRKMDRFDPNKTTEIIVSSMARFVGLKAARLKSGKNILLVSGDFQIREINLDVDNDLGKPISSLAGVRLPLSVDFDVNEDMIYWTELETKTIRKAYRNGTDEQVLAAGNIEYPSGLALSSQTNELFWVDKTLALIQKIHLSTHTRTILINDNLTSPSDIALDLRVRYIYWTDTAKKTIERATYSGVNRYTVLDNLDSPIALVLDLIKELIYWGEFVSAKVYRANLDGTGQEQLVSGLRVSQLAILNEFLYWSEFELNYTGRINRYTAQDFSILIARNERFMGLGIMKEDNGTTFKNITPLIGPVAGGTNITITGNNFMRVLEVRIGEDLKCIIHKMNTSTIVAASPAFNITGDEKDFLIYVEFTSGSYMSTGYRFTYKPDPVVSSLHPLTTLKEGGTILTVTGSNLDSVVKPVLKLTRVQQTVEINTSKILKETITTRYGECNTVNRTQLACITPQFENTTRTLIETENRKRRSLQQIYQQVKTTLLQVLRADKFGGESHHIVKREAHTKQIDIIYAGIKLDGVKKFLNLSKNDETREFGKINFIKPPTFNHSGNEGEFVFSHGQKISINGEEIDKLAADNYKVDIGLGQCDDISLTNTKLFCLPPQKEPDRVDGQAQHVHRIVVHIGRNIAENIGDLVYPFNTNLYLGLGCAGVLLLAIVAIVIVLVCRRQAGKSREQNRQAIQNGQHSTSQADLIHLPPVNNYDTSIGEVYPPKPSDIKEINTMRY